MKYNLIDIKKAKQGDVAAFANLYRQVYEDLYRFALYNLKNRADAEDVVSETVVDAFTTIKNLRKEESFKGWIFRILYNKCKDKLKEYTKKTVELTEEYAEKSSTEKLEEGAVMRTLFYKLSEEERMIISMHLFAGYTSKEIGIILDINENTVRSKESRALKKLGDMAK